jgi:hypothetical protein
MNKPDTYLDLLELVNPKDLLDIFDFSGINDKKESPHWDLRRKYSNLIWESIKNYREKEPRYTIYELNEEFYTTLIKCMQDFYYWSHKHNHPHAFIHKRVMNALNIKVEEINALAK